MEDFDAAFCAIGLTLGVTIKHREILQRNKVKTVAIVNDSQAAIRQTAHLEPGHG